MTDLPSELQQGSVFNMSLESLSRINELLKDCSAYSVNYNWLGLKNNLLEIYKEVVRCSNVKDEDMTELESIWEEIENHECYVDKRGCLMFDDELPPLLTRFDFVISRLLYKQGLTMAKGDDAGRSLK